MKETRFGVAKEGAVNNLLRSIKSTRKSSYKTYSSKRRFQIAKYANETGRSAAVRKFKLLFPDSKENTIRGFRKKYLDQMKLAEKRNRSPERLIVNMQRGRPLLLGNNIDEKVRKCVMTIRYKGGQATFSTAIAVAKAFIEQGDNESLKVLKFGKHCARNFFRQLNFGKCAATTGKVIIPDGAWKNPNYLLIRYCNKN